MGERISRQDYLVGVIKLLAKRSTCLRGSVGAVIVRDGRIISTGYNGSPKGLLHCSTSTCDLNSPCKRAVHAEMNAILFSARHGIGLEGSELYCSTLPCYECSKAIAQSGINTVNYLEVYRDTSGRDLLVSLGITVNKLEIDVNQSTEGSN